ncbi:diguanylate cyclase [Solibacillus sp. MA9]|uniref:Diguanylate cyclase n=1 Tax=Solibacillus palustris TaxID=2908203 RepID=A0ABS9U872_9BACL|nr:diguanylate cyclase [Solibacillus sp. MA9]MCH7320522.1 diguanylate cyclase [Solibacillus sp. MA9]
MFLEFIIYFSILFCFTTIIHWSFILSEDVPFIKKYNSMLIGLLFGVAAFTLTIITAPFVDGILIHNYNILVLFSGLLGGPVSMLISGMIILISRYDLCFTSTISFIMMLNLFIITIALYYAARKYPITYRNITYYFLAVTFEHILLLLIYWRFSLEIIHYLMLLLIFTSIIFYLLRVILLQLDHRNKQIKQIYVLKQMDLLTQLPNHVATEQKLKCLMQTKIPFELLHLDLRKFSTVNHQYGYELGDEFFAKIANIIQRQLPEESFIGRIDSDEFYIALLNTTPAEAIMQAYQINEAIKNSAFKQDLTLQITSAIGICSSSNYVQLPQLLNATYRALRFAKNQTTTWICHDNQLKNRQNKTHDE